MKTITNITLENSEGKPLKDGASQKDLNAVTLIQAVLNNVKYKSREDQRKADKVYEKLEAVEGGIIELEDAEFELIYQYASEYEPFLNGRMFMPFLDELDRVK